MKTRYEFKTDVKELSSQDGKVLEVHLETMVPKGKIIISKPKIPIRSKELNPRKSRPDLLVEKNISDMHYSYVPDFGFDE